MKLEDNENYRLLQDVLPSYLAALPPPPHSTDADLRRIGELRTEIKRVNAFADILRYFDPHGQLPEDVELALELLLFAFDSLVDNCITVRIPSDVSLRDQNPAAWV